MHSAIPKCYFPASAAWCYFGQTIRSHALRCINTFGNQQQQAKVQTSKKGVNFAVRSLTFADIPQVMDIRRQIGSIEVESCLRSWLTLDPECIKIAITNSNEIIGTCSSAKNCDEEDGFLFGGLFYVKPEYRNRGIGATLWNSCLDHIGSRNAGLNAVSGKLDVYSTAGGFPVYDDSFKTVEYRITSSDFASSSLSNTPPPGIKIRHFHPYLLPLIFAYDYDLIGFRRSSALLCNVMETGSRTLVALRSDTACAGFGTGVCAGFGTVKRNCAGAVRVGPLYADEPEVAEVLFRRLVGMMNAEAAGVVFVTTSANPHVKKWMNRSGVGAWKTCDRLYTKKKMDVDLEKVFALFDVNFAPF